MVVGNAVIGGLAIVTPGKCPGGAESLAKSPVMTSRAESCCPRPLSPSYPLIYHFDPHVLP